jgi:hypothetical protein
VIYLEFPVSRGQGTLLVPHAPPRPDEILGLDLYGSHLPIFGAFLDVLHELLLLVLQLDPLPVQFALGLLECSLMLSKPFCRGHALSESPFYDLKPVGKIPCMSAVLCTYIHGD